jgi:hypothetical protein
MVVSGTVGGTVSGTVAGIVVSMLVVVGADPAALCVVPPQAASADTPRASSAAVVRVVRKVVVVRVMSPACSSRRAATRVRAGVRPVVWAPPRDTP